MHVRGASPGRATQASRCHGPPRPVVDCPSTRKRVLWLQLRPDCELRDHEPLGVEAAIKLARGERSAAVQCCRRHAQHRHTCRQSSSRVVRSQLSFPRVKSKAVTYPRRGGELHPRMYHAVPLQLMVTIHRVACTQTRRAKRQWTCEDGRFGERLSNTTLQTSRCLTCRPLSAVAGLPAFS